MEKKVLRLHPKVLQIAHSLIKHFGYFEKSSKHASTFHCLNLYNPSSVINLTNPLFFHLSFEVCIIQVLQIESKIGAIFLFDSNLKGGVDTRSHSIYN